MNPGVALKECQDAVTECGKYFSWHPGDCKVTESHLGVQVPLLGKKVWTRVEWGGQSQLKNSEFMSGQDLWFSLGGKILESGLWVKHYHLYFLWDSPREQVEGIPQSQSQHWTPLVFGSGQMRQGSWTKSVVWSKMAAQWTSFLSQTEQDLNKHIIFFFFSF